jgi:hypothetical protein
LQAIGRLQDERHEQGQTILTRLVEALKADELTVALGPALQEAQQQAVRLLALVKLPRLKTPSGWKPVESGENDSLTGEDLRRLLAELEQKLTHGGRRRLRISWTLLEEETR